MNKRYFLLIAIVALSGCNSSRTPPAVPQVTDDTALDLVEKRIVEMAKPKPPPTKAIAGIKVTAPAQIPVPDQEPEKVDISDMALKYRDWLFFAAYCLVALIAGWYWKKTGQNSETLDKINGTLNSTLPFKQKVLFRILRMIYRKKAKKKAERIGK